MEHQNTYAFLSFLHTGQRQPGSNQCSKRCLLGNADSNTYAQLNHMLSYTCEAHGVHCQSLLLYIFRMYYTYSSLIKIVMHATEIHICKFWLKFQTKAKCKPALERELPLSPEGVGKDIGKRTKTIATRGKNRMTCHCVNLALSLSFSLSLYVCTIIYIYIK